MTNNYQVFVSLDAIEERIIQAKGRGAIWFSMFAALSLIGAIATYLALQLSVPGDFGQVAMPMPVTVGDDAPAQVAYLLSVIVHSTPGSFIVAISTIAALVAFIVGITASRQGIFLIVIATLLTIPGMTALWLKDAPSPGGDATAQTFLSQLHAEQRLADMATAAGVALPKGAAAYVRAQVAYLTQDKVRLKAELHKMNTNRSADWVFDWGRIQRMEETGFGSVIMPETTKRLEERTREALNCAIAAIIALCFAGTCMVIGLKFKRDAADHEAEFAEEKARQDANRKPLSTPSRPRNPNWTPACHGKSSGRSSIDSPDSDSSYLMPLAAGFSMSTAHHSANDSPSSDGGGCDAISAYCDAGGL